MVKKVALILTLMLVGLLAVASVSAADNLTDDINDNSDMDFNSTEDISIDSNDYYLNCCLNESMDSNDVMLENNESIEEFNKYDDDVLMASGKVATNFVMPERFQDSFKLWITTDSGSKVYDYFTYTIDSDVYKHSAYSGDNIYMANLIDSFHTIHLYYDGSNYYEPCYQSFKFYYVRGGYSEFTCYWPKDTYFSVSSTAYGGINVELSSIYSKLDNIKFEYCLDNSGKKFSSKNGIIPLNFEPDTYHNITLTFSGNSEYKSCSKTVKFIYKSSIIIRANEKYFVDGGMNIPYQILNFDGKVSKSTFSFAPFGTNDIVFSNSFNGENIIKEITIPKRILQTEDLIINYTDLIEYRIRAANEDNLFTSGMTISFILDGQSYSVKTDSDGYATLKVHLKSGTYVITTKYCGVVNKNSITVCPIYVDNKYKNVRLNSITSYFGENKLVNYGWEGNLNGTLKVYKGSSLIKSISLDTSGYVGDYFTYDTHKYTFSTSKLNAGNYVFRIVNGKGAVIAESKVNIRKIPTAVSSYNVNVYKNSKQILYFHLYGKKSKNSLNGKVKVKINGKFYNVNVKKGWGKLVIKTPSAFKKYNCGIIYGGDKNYESSYGKFIMNVIKFNSDVHVSDIENVNVGTKIILKALVKYNNDAKRVTSGFVNFYFNGKTYSAKINKGIAKVTIKAPSIAKTYTCKASYLGNKNVKSTSTTFKINVHKKTKSKVVTFTVNVPIKLNAYTSKTVGEYKIKFHKYTTGYHRINLTLNLYKNGKKVKSTSSKYKTQVWIHLKSGSWKYWGTNNYGSLSFSKTTYDQYLQVDKAKVKVTIK